VAASVWFSGPRQVEVRNEVLAPPGPGDVCIEAFASAISHGTEMLAFRGQVPEELELDLPTLRGSFAFPLKYGYASVGRVVQTGSQARRLHPGDLVFTLHPHQSAYVVSETLPIVLPQGIEPEHGVFLANAETATNIVLDAAPRLGERVVVFGQGVVGLLITQLLKRTSASEVAVVEPIARRRELALRVGADVALESARGGEFDLAIEASGNPAALDEALQSVAFGGTVIVCSWYGTKPVPLTLGSAFHRRRLRVVSSQVSTIDAALQPRWSRERRLDLARGLLPKLELASLISHRIPIDRAAEAYRLVDEHAADTVQVVLTYATSRR
jgi:2-desacetyl-2-hydroxyethyl bacteriochlorophyllide A dehydrogenase